MADSYLRHVPSGVVFIAQPIFSQRADFVPCNLDGSDIVPEAPPAPAPRRAKAPVAPAPAPAPVEPPADDSALSADASRNINV